jgi:hypothetical protein
MDIWECFAQRDAELAQQSVGWDDKPEPYSAESGSKDLRGMVYGRITLSEHAFLSVHEVLEVQGDEATRRKYAYYLMYDGAPLWGEECDPQHEVAARRYDRDGTRVSSQPISLTEALVEASRIARAEESVAD